MIYQTTSWIKKFFKAHKNKNIQKGARERWRRKNERKKANEKNHHHKNCEDFELNWISMRSTFYAWIVNSKDPFFFPDMEQKLKLKAIDLKSSLTRAWTWTLCDNARNKNKKTSEQEGKRIINFHIYFFPTFDSEAFELLWNMHCRGENGTPSLTRTHKN